MKKTTLATVLLLSAMMAAPASANWFFRPDAGISLNVGSAPNPTPNDLRILYGPLRYQVSAAVLRDMTGKSVYGENGEHLGMIAAVDERHRIVEMRIADGRSVVIEGSLLINEPDRVIAPTLSMAEVVAAAA